MKSNLRLYSSCLQKRDDRTMTSGSQGEPCFSGDTAWSWFKKTADFVEEKLGGELQ